MDYVDVLCTEMSSKAVTPTRATEHSVGLDLYSPSDYMSCDDAAASPLVNR